MKAVVDASVIVRAVLPGQPYHAEVRRWLAGVTELLAPHLLPFEVTTAIRHLEFTGVVPPDAAEAALAEALRLRVRLCSGPRAASTFKRSGWRANLAFPAHTMLRTWPSPYTRLAHSSPWTSDSSETLPRTDIQCATRLITPP